MLLNNQWITEETKEEIKKHQETNEKLLKATKEKWQITYKGTPEGSQLISKQKLYKPEGSGMTYLK